MEIAPTTRPKRILLAEDDADIRYILIQVLKDAGYEVEALSTGNTIVDSKSDWPDLFILDKSLPVIDGLALCKFLRINKATQHIPIIMMSCYHKIKDKAHQVGVNAFIEKPFNIQAFLDAVESHINLKRDQRQL